MSCDSGTCKTNVGGKSVSSGSSCQPCHPSQSGCDAGACACPVEQVIDKWSGAFCHALTAVQVELLKDRIKKAWGPILEKEADAVVASLGAQWHAKLTAAKAHVDLRENIRNILESAKA